MKPGAGLISFLLDLSPGPFHLSRHAAVRGQDLAPPGFLWGSFPPTIFTSPKIGKLVADTLGSRIIFCDVTPNTKSEHPSTLARSTPPGMPSQNLYSIVFLLYSIFHDQLIFNQTNFAEILPLGRSPLQPTIQPQNSRVGCPRSKKPLFGREGFKLPGPG